MKIHLKQVEIVELNALKDEVLQFANYQKNIIDQITDDSEKYNRLILMDIGTTLYFNFGTRIINNLKSHGKTHCTFSISLAEAALLQFVCCFNVGNKPDFTQYVLGKFSRLIDEKIKSIN